MDILNYMAITAAYSVGCYCAFRYGRNKGWSAGMDYTMRETFERLKSKGLTPNEILELLKASGA